MDPREAPDGHPGPICDGDHSPRSAFLFIFPTLVFGSASTTFTCSGIAHFSMWPAATNFSRYVRSDSALTFPLCVSRSTM